VSDADTGRPPRSRHRRLAPALTRREFLKDVAATTVVAAGAVTLGFLAYSDEPVHREAPVVRRLPDFRVEPSAMHPLLAVVHGTQPEAMVREAVARLGGIGRFVKKGDRVLVKPNVGWDRQPEQAANTNPDVVGAIVRLCREAGASKVWVSDVSLNDPARCFVRSGIQAASLAAGADVRLPGANDFVATDMGGSLLRVWPVSRFFHEVDKVVNVPIVKHHSLCGCTLAMKNWYGVLGGRRNQLHQDIHTSIVDLAQAVRPTLTVMDAIRVLKRNGPTGGSLGDVAIENTVVAGLDEVAIDAWSLQLLGLTPDRVRYLAMGEARGLGVVDWRSLNWVEGRVG
jgi:uncharacterized protein (DUF362 family)